MAPPARNQQKDYDKAYEDAEVWVLQKSRIVITTCANAYLHSALMKGDPPKIIRPVKFDTIVVDEATRATKESIYHTPIMSNRK